MNNGEQSLASGAVPAEAGAAGSPPEAKKSENHDPDGRQPVRGLPWAATWVILPCVAALVNGVAGILFIAVAPVHWDLALLIAGGSIVGGQVGAKVGRRLPAPALRMAIIGVGLVAEARLLLG